jgi:hypothetical protein
MTAIEAEVVSELTAGAEAMTDAILKAQLEEAGRNLIRHHEQELLAISRRNARAEREERRLDLCIKAFGLVLLGSSVALLWLVWKAL